MRAGPAGDLKTQRCPRQWKCRGLLLSTDCRHDGLVVLIPTNADQMHRLTSHLCDSAEFPQLFRPQSISRAFDLAEEERSKVRCVHEEVRGLRATVSFPVTKNAINGWRQELLHDGAFSAMCAKLVLTDQCIKACDLVEVSRRSPLEIVSTLFASYDGEPEVIGIEHERVGLQPFLGESAGPPALMLRSLHFERC